MEYIKEEKTKQNQKQLLSRAPSMAHGYWVVVKKLRITGLYVLRALWALGPARSLTRPHFLAGAPACRRTDDGKEEPESRHQPRAHAHPSLSFRVCTSHTTGTLCAIPIKMFQKYGKIYIYI